MSLLDHSLNLHDTFLEEFCTFRSCMFKDRFSVFTMGTDNESNVKKMWDFLKEK